MALKKCPECKQQVSSDAKTCPHCGKKLEGLGCGAFIICVILGLLIASASQSGPSTSPQKQASPSPIPTTSSPNVATPSQKTISTSNSSTNDSAKEAKDSYLERLTKEQKGLETFTVKDYLKVKESILLAVGLFNEYAKMIEEGKRYSLDGNNRALWQNFRKRVSAVQQQSFPKLREAYGRPSGQALWEQDITAKATGNGFKTIVFVGAVFAANRNIKTANDAISSTLQQLRFGDVQYKWIEHADHFVHSKLDPISDGEFVVWSSDDSYRKVD